jgi:hypothetical protein
VASTISRAKEALAKTRARAAATGSLAGSPSSSRVHDPAAVSDKPFTLFGKVDLPPPRPAVQVSQPGGEDVARRKWVALEKL